MVIFFVPTFLIFSASLSFAQEEKEDRWFLTSIEVADLEGKNSYRVSSTTTTEITRKKLETGEYEFNYVLREAAGQVAGEKEPTSFVSTKSFTFYRDPKSHILRTEDKELKALFDFINTRIKKILPKEKPAETWKQDIEISSGSKYMPEKITLNFEIQYVSFPSYEKLLLIKYFSEEFSFLAMDDNGELAKGRFSGFLTYDSDRKIFIHSIWNFETLLWRNGEREDSFTHQIVSFMSEQKGEKPVVPFTIYPELAKALKDPKIEFRRISSIQNPPRFFSQAFGLSKYAMTLTEITAEKSTNPVILAIIGVAIFADAVVDAATDIFNDGKINDNGFSAFRWAGGSIAEMAGVDRKYGECVAEAGTFYGGLITPSPVQLLGAKGKVLKLAQNLDKVNNVVDLLNVVNSCSEASEIERKKSNINQTTKIAQKETPPEWPKRSEALKPIEDLLPTRDKARQLQPAQHQFTPEQLRRLVTPSVAPVPSGT